MSGGLTREVDTFGIGEDSGQPVPFDYQPPNRFTGEIEKVVIDLELKNPKGHVRYWHKTDIVMGATQVRS